MLMPQPYTEMFESGYASHFAERLNMTALQPAGIKLQNSSSKNFCAPSVKISGILEGAT